MKPSSEDATQASYRPSGHVDTQGRDDAGGTPGTQLKQPKLGFLGWIRFFWRQLTSMPTALLLLLMLAIAAIPGSLVPQRVSNPNGVTEYFAENPELAPILDAIQMFDVYSSVWFSAIYLLLFVSLIGCVIPRTKHHWRAMRSDPPRTPARLSRLADYQRFETDRSAEQVIEQADALLKKRKYRRVRYDRAGVLSISAERGFLRETGNLLFHISLLGVLVSVAIGGAATYYGQRVIIEGQTFSNTLAAYDSFSPGQLFDDSQLAPFSITLESFETTYETENLSALGQPLDFLATLTVTEQGEEPREESLRVNHPVGVAGSQLYLLGNGYAPVITVRDADGNVSFSDAVPFLPQDGNLTSVGVIKVPDISPEQIGMVGFFYPTQAQLETGAYVSSYPGLIYPKLTLNVYTGDLGIDDGVPRSVYTLDTDDMTPIATREIDTPPLELEPNQTVDLPNGLGTVTFDEVKRFVSIDIRNDASQTWVLWFALLAVFGLLTSLFVPRRRMWVAVQAGDGITQVEVAGLARGEDPALAEAVGQFSTLLQEGDDGTEDSQGIR